MSAKEFKVCSRQDDDDEEKEPPDPEEAMAAGRVVTKIVIRICALLIPGLVLVLVLVLSRARVDGSVVIGDSVAGVV